MIKTISSTAVELLKKNKIFWFSFFMIPFSLSLLPKIIMVLSCEINLTSILGSAILIILILTLLVFLIILIYKELKMRSSAKEILTKISVFIALIFMFAFLSSAVNNILYNIMLSAGEITELCKNELSEYGQKYMDQIEGQSDLPKLMEEAH